MVILEEPHLPLPSVESFQIRPLDVTMKTEAVRFISSWSLDDVYDRFGSVGIDGQAWLTTELTQRERRALIAVHASGVVGLLDHVYAEGAIHIGIVVASRFRRSSIGTHLVQALLQMRYSVHPVAADCRIDNRPAIALLRKCRFQRLSVERGEMIWRYA